MILSVKKASKYKTNYFLPLRSFCVCEKMLPTLVFCLYNFVLLVSFCFWHVFVHAKSFHKKNKLAWNCPDNLIYYTTDQFPYQLTYQEFICTHLWQSAGFLYIIIWQNLFPTCTHPFLLVLSEFIFICTHLYNC